LLLNTVIRHPVSCKVSRDTGSADVVIPSMIPGVNFYNPPQFQLCRFIIVLALIPDIVFGTDSYTHLKPMGERDEIYTEWISTRKPLDEQRFELQIKDLNRLIDSNSMVLAIGVEYGQAVSNTVIERVKYGGCASILATG